MPLYRYIGENLQGHQMDGQIEAISPEALKSYLRDKGMFLVEYKQVGNSKAIQSFFSKVTLKELALFCRQFAVIINAGIGIIEAIDILRQQATKKQMYLCLTDIYDDIRRGSLLSESLKKHPVIFPEFMINMVKVGEMSGNLDVVFARLADYYEKDYKMRNKVKSAMVYPMILLSLTVVIVTMLMVFVLPIFSTTLSSFGGELPTITKVLMAISSGMVEYAFLWMPAVAIAGFLWHHWLRTEQGAYWKDGFKLKMPIINNIQIKIITSRFSRSMGTLLKSGIPVVEAMEIMEALLGNKIVQNKFKVAKMEMKKGMGVAASLETMKIFNPLLINMVRVGETTGELDVMLERTSVFFDNEVEESVKRATTFVEPIMIIVLAIVVGVILLSVMLPMLNIMESI